MNPSRIRSNRLKPINRARRSVAHSRHHYPEIWRSAPGSVAAKVVSQLLAARPAG